MVDERNDVVWIMQGDAIVEKRSMHVPGLDDGRVDEGDPDLIVEARGGDGSQQEWIATRWVGGWFDWVWCVVRG